MAPLLSSRYQKQPQASKVQHTVHPRPASTALHAPPRLHDLRKNRYGHRLRNYRKSIDHNWRPRQVTGDSGEPLGPSLGTTPTSLVDPTAIASPSSHSKPDVHGTPHGSTDIVFIAVGSAVAVLLISFSIFLFVKAHWCSLSSAFKCCYRRRRPRPRGIGFSPRKISRPMPLDDDEDDHYMHTPTTFVYVERFDGPPQLQLEKTEGHGLFTSAQLETALNRIIPPPPRSHPPQKAQNAEGVISAPALQGSCEHIAGPLPPISSQTGSSYSAIAGRPRGASDASQSSSSEFSETEETDVTELFSPRLMTSNQSSMTSVASLESIDVASSDEDEEVFEVKRAHSQSIEFKKGVLMAFASQASGLSQSSSAPVESPSIVVTEPSPIAKASSCNTIYSLSGSCSSRLGVSDMSTGPSISSLACENSVGTVSSMSSNISLETRTETSCGADEDHSPCQPRVPFLMVTKPSSSSIYTLSTQTSSVDLEDFPVPPAVAKPTKPLYMKLMEQAQTHALEMSQRRAWRNHPENASMKQRRSTVEQFIMMYASA